MLELHEDFHGQTVICTFDVTPGSAQDVLDLLTRAYDEVVSHRPGYLGGAIHLNDAQTRICTYSKWRCRDDYKAMLRSPEMRARNLVINERVRSFEPVMYEVASVHAVADAPQAEA